MTKKLTSFAGQISFLSASALLFLIVLLFPPTFSRASSFSLPAVSVQKVEKASFQKRQDDSENTLAEEPLQNVWNAFSLEMASVAASDVTFSPAKLDELKKIPSSEVLGDAASALPPFVVTCQADEEEFEMLLYCLDHETHGSVEHRVIIAEVVLNRVQGPRFGSTIREVLMAPNQFSPMVFYENREAEGWVPSEAAVTAARMVLENRAPDLARGATYFCNPTIVGEDNWFDQSLTPLLEIEGHRFYQ